MRSLVLALLFVASTAMATGNHKPPTPAPTPTPPSSNSSSNSSSASGAKAGAEAGAEATAGSTLSNFGNSDYRSGSYFLALPTPVFTPPLPMSGCAQANATQSATSVGWSFFSHAEGKLDADNCTAITLYNSFLEQCKFASAEQVLNLLTRKILPDFKPSDLAMLDLTAKECALLKAPPPAPVKVIYEPAPAAATCPPPAATPRGAKPAAKPARAQAKTCR